MTTSKKSKPTESTKSTKKAEQLMYIGPTLSAGRLYFSTIFMGGLPTHIKALIEKHPWFSGLFVPIEGLDAAIKATKIKGNYLNTLYVKAQKEV